MIDTPNAFEQELERQARMFSAQRNDGDDTGSRIFIVADFEYRYDRDAHAGYRIADGAAAEPKIRWPFHRIEAAAWTVLRFIPGQPIPEIEPLIVLTADESDEKAIVSAFFAALQTLPQAVLVTWGGEAKDLAALRLAAAMHDLSSPHHLLDLSPYSSRRLDLCNATSVAAPSVHLPEYAAALAIPSKPSPSKDIGRLVERQQWPLVEDQVVADVLTTCVIALGHLTSMGRSPAIARRPSWHWPTRRWMPCPTARSSPAPSSRGHGSPAGRRPSRHGLSPRLTSGVEDDDDSSRRKG